MYHSKTKNDEEFFGKIEEKDIIPQKSNKFKFVTILVEDPKNKTSREFKVIKDIIKQ